MGEKIFAGNGKVVGEVCGRTFRKTFKGSRHMLQKPRAIANDVAVLEDAERAGAVEVEERDTETGAVYSTTIATIRAHGFRVNRGYGEQIALAVNRWQIRGGMMAGSPGCRQPVQLAFDLVVCPQK